MRSRLILVAALVLAAAAVAASVLRALSGPVTAAPVARASLPARAASYLGVYENGAPGMYRRVTEFGRAAGRAPDLVGYFSGWSQPFATAFARRVRARGATPLVQIDPAQASVAGIADGVYDVYLRAFATSVREFGGPVVIGFGHEMNASWYPWGYRHVAAARFVAAWRHIVSVFRGQGAGNVTWLWTINADLPATGPLTDWWPGPGYVTWVGIDGYYYRPSDTFAGIFGPTIAQVRGLTGKPVLISETAVGPRAGQPAKIGDLLRGVARYRTLGLVWFDNAQHYGVYHQDWRLEDHPAARAAFRRAVARTLTTARSPRPGRSPA